MAILFGRLSNRRKEITMKGPWKMLTGKGGREHRDAHREFDNAIPNRFPFRAGDVVRTGPGDMDIRDLRPGDERLPSHPAYEGPLAKTRDAELYRRAHAVRGGTTKVQHKMLEEYQRTHSPSGEPIEQEQKGILQWLFGK
jgi:hypothetical protein